MKKIALLGSTGSIGKQVLNVVDRYQNEYQVVSLCCNSNAKLLSEQIDKYKPIVAGITNSAYSTQIQKLPNQTTLYTGENALLHCVIEQADIVFVAVVGFCGLKAVIQALNMKKVVALANKESLVAGGEIVCALAKQNNCEIIPVDSEHSALWQCLNFNKTMPFKKLILTASGGALRDVPIENLRDMTVSQALKHPNWNMGAKITIDCATMLNKGLEVMEAMWLYDCPLEKIDVLIHTQSIVHSMVMFEDNAIMAQMGLPSMEIPIQLALTYPNRLYSGVGELDLTTTSLDFKQVDLQRYPCFKLALEVAKKGKNLPCAFSGANEKAVELFLKGQIKYDSIYKYVDYAVQKTTLCDVSYQSLEYTNVFAVNCVEQAFKEKKFE